MSYQLIAFDFDGTLADSFDCFLTALSESAQLHGFRSLDATLIEQARSMSAREIIALLGVPLWKVPRVTIDMRRRMRARRGDIALFPGIEAALAALAASGARLAVLTSNAEDTVRAILGPACAQIERFHCGIPIFGKTRKLQALAAAAGVPREALLYVGDEIRDAQAAAKAGVGFRGVAWGYTAPRTLQAHCAAPVLSTPDDLVALASARTAPA
jgi:phosphoglycolate phosphatase